MSITQSCVLLLYWNMMLSVVVNHTIAVMVTSNNWLSLMYDSDKYHSVLGVTVKAQLHSTCHQTNTTWSEMSIVSNITTNMQTACKLHTWIVLTTIMPNKLSLWPKVTEILNWSLLSIYNIILIGVASCNIILLAWSWSDHQMKFSYRIKCFFISFMPYLYMCLLHENILKIVTSLTS